MNKKGTSTSRNAQSDPEHDGRLHLLADISLRLSQMETGQEAVDFVCQQIKGLVGKGYVGATLLDEDTQMMSLKALVGLEDEGLVNAGLRLTGTDPRKTKFRVAEFTPEELATFSSGHIEQVKDGLYGLLVRKYPRTVCNALEHLLGVRFIYTIGFVSRDHYIGGVIILTDSESVVKANNVILENVVAQAAAIINRIHTEELLHTSELKFRNLAESISDVYFSMDKDLRYTYWNKASETLTGISAKEAIGRTLTELFPDNEARKQIKESYLRVLESKQPQHFTQYYPGQQIIVHEVNTYPTVDGVAVFAKDITERKRTEEALCESEERYRSLFNTMKEGVAINEIVLDEKGDVVDYIVLSVNPAFKQQSMYSIEQVAGKRATDVYQMSPEYIRSWWKSHSQITNSVQTEFYHEPSGRWFNITTTPPEGKRFATIFNDITQRKQAAEALRQSEIYLRATLDSTDNGVLAVDSHGKVIYLNDRFVEIWHIPPELLEKRDDAVLLAYVVEQLIEPQTFLNRVQQLYASQKIDFDTLYFKDGRIFDRYSTPLLLQKETVGRVWSFRDVTERKKVEKQLADSEIRYRRLFEAAKDGILILEAETGIIIDVNPYLIEMTGLAEEQFLGKQLWELGFFKDMVANKENLLELQKKQYIRYEDLPLQTADGRRLDVEFISNVYDVDHTKIIQCNVRNITERKKAEEQLALQSRLLDIAVDSVFVFKLEDGKFVYVNQVACESHGYTRDELLNMTVQQIDTPESARLIEPNIKELMEKGQTTFNAEHFHKDGSIIPVEIHASSADLNGQTYIISIARDITERKRADEAIRASEEKFHSIFDNSSEGIAVYQLEQGDVPSKYTEVNQTMCRMLGYTRAELLKLTPMDITKSDNGLSPVQNTLKQLRAYGRTTGQRVNLTKDNRELQIEISAHLTTLQGKDTVIVIARDITESKRIEVERQRAEKLDSIGTLAGGIAHDFNNILTGILGNIQLAEGYLKQDRKDTAQEMLSEADKASFRARDLTQQLLTFSKGGLPVKKVISINQLIRDSATFALRGSSVKPEFALPDNLWAVDADEGQINQVINNLVINADQAMPNGGTINVSARNVVNGANLPLLLTEGNYVEITIKDQGTGIPPSLREKIFDPYFTTKQKGSGLGLASSLSIIKNHGGTITFESEMGKGTTFHIYLPATQESVKKEKPEVVVSQSQPVATGRILVMDDEAAILMLLNRTLKSAGYEVVQTKNGTEAIQQYREAKESGKPIDAVILDLTVPGGMGGKETMVKLLEIDPEVKAIVSSGYANDPIMAEFKKYGFSGVVTKPYDIKQMQETLRKVLAGK